MFYKYMWALNKMQLDMADFAPMQPPLKLHETYASSLILAYLVIRKTGDT